MSYLFEERYTFKFADYKKFNNDVNDVRDGSSRYFSDVPKNVIIDFLKGIKYSMANPRFDARNIIDFLGQEDNTGLELWDVVFESGKSESYYEIDGLRNIKRMVRTICSTNRNIIQISTRRRVLTGSMEGRFALSKGEIELAEKKQREWWKENNEDSEGRNIPVKAYFRFLPQRKPLLVIMLIQPQASDEKTKEFINMLGDESIVAFAIGCPGVKDEGAAVKYQVNKVFQQLNIEGDEPEEEDDDE